MTEIESSKEKPSERAYLPGGGGLVGLVCGCLGGAVMAYPYAHIAARIPVFYLPVPFLLGWGIGAACGLGSRLGGRLRTWPGRLLGGLSGVVAIYASWVFWILATSAYKVFLVSPAAMYKHLLGMARDGVWTMAFWGADGWTPKGSVLLLIWVLEFLVVCWMAGGCAGMYCKEREQEVEKESNRVF